MNHEERTRKITAYLFGELSELDRVAFERELASDAELRAEKERLAATIGLVRGALKSEGSADGADALSAGSHATLLAAARASAADRGTTARTPWHRSRTLRLAAGFVVLFGAAALATRAWVGSGEASVESARGARVTESEERPPAPTAGASGSGPAAESKDAADEVRERLRGLGYLGGGDAGSSAARTKDGESNLLSESQVRALEFLDRAEPTDEPAPARQERSASADDTELLSQLGDEEGPTSGGENEGATGDLARFVRTSPTGEVQGNDEASGRASSTSRDSLAVATTPAPSEEAAKSDADAFTDTIGIGGGAGGGKFGKRTVRLGRSGGAASGPASPASPGAPTTMGAGPVQERQDTWFLGHGGQPQVRELDGEQARRAREQYVQGEFSAQDLDELLVARAELREELREKLEALGYRTGEDDAPPARGDRRLTAEQLFAACRRYPGESPSAMFFRFWGDNAFELAALDRLSTFAVDVDTASYTLARRYLAEGRVPGKAQVRTEEFVNYFDAGVEPPTEAVFDVHTDLAPSRFGGDERPRWMLRVVLSGREVQDFERKPVALTFVVDTSGSMSTDARLELVKTSLRLLLTKLDANDAIAIVAFSSEARMVLPMTSAANRDTIEMALAQLRPNGSTNAEAGLKLGYAHAKDHFTEGASNRVIFLSDGVANVGQTDQDRLTDEVERFRDRGIYLNTVGVGFGNHNDVFLEQLADQGDGICDYVDNALEARKAFVENFTGKIETIARDVKVQVEFDPSSVVRYRLLGYENRAVADEDFRNDAVDAGEIGAGHQVTALYELELADLGGEDTPLATVRVRWKAPHGEAPEGRDPEAAFEVAHALSAADVATSFAATPAGYRKAVVVAQFAELLRRSIHARGDSLDELIAEAGRVAELDDDPDFDELVQLLGRGRERILATLPAHDELRLAVDAYRRNQFLRAQLEDAARDRDAQLLRDLERENERLEQRIRDLLGG